MQDHTVREYSRIVKQLIFGYFFAYAAIPISYILRIMLSKDLSVTDFGLLYAAIGFLMFIAFIIEFGFSESLTYHIAQAYARKEYGKVKGYFRFSICTQFLIHCAFLTWIFFSKDFLEENYFKVAGSSDILLILGIFIAFYNLQKQFIGFVVATQRYIHTELTELLRNGALLFALTLSMPITLSFATSMWATSAALIAIIYYIGIRITYTEVFSAHSTTTRKDIKDFMSYASTSVIGSSGSIIISQIGIVLITYFMTVEDVAIYSNALALSNSIFSLAGPVAGFILPIVAQYFALQKIDQIKDLMRSLYNLGLYITIPVVWGLIIFGKELLEMLFGQAYGIGSTTLSVLLIANLFAILYLFNIGAISGTGNIKLKAKYLYLGCGASVFANIILIPILGIIGSALGLLIGNVIIFILSFIFLQKNRLALISTKNIAKIIVANILVFIIASTLKKIIILNNMYEIIIVVGVCGIAYLLLGLGLKIIDIKYYLKLIWKDPK